MPFFLSYQTPFNPALLAMTLEETQKKPATWQS